MNDALVEPFTRMLSSLEARPADAQWGEIEASGYLDALVPEALGGAGLSLAEVEPLLSAIGYHGIDQPIADTMLERAGATGRNVMAVAAASQIAGAGQRVLEMAIAHANERVQFGKPIGRQQAIQQQLAVMAEQVLMARMAAQIGCAAGLDPSEKSAAIAKHIASAAVPAIAAIAHAVHGAIGITQEHALHRFTARMHALRVAHGSESWWAERLGQAVSAPDAGSALSWAMAWDAPCAWR